MRRTSSTSRPAAALALALGALAAAAAAVEDRPAEDPAADQEPAPAQQAVPGGWELDPPAPADIGLPAAVEGWEQISCARCHREITAEWAGSLHGLAWDDPHYQRAIARMRRPASCHGCHVPEPLLAGAPPDKPVPRERRRHQGVDCRACHAGPDDAMLGPWGVQTFAHASARSEAFIGERANALCVSCHATHIGPVIGIAKDFVARDPEGRLRTCVGCHMAAVERSHAHDPDDEGPAPVRPGRSHALQTPRDPAFLRRAFGLSAHHPAEGGTLLRVENRAGHRVPGLEGRELELVVTGFDAARGATEEARFTISKASHLPADEALLIPLAMRAASVRVRGLHRAPGLDGPVEFLDLELRPAAAAAGGR